jgi:BirA family biotin operon repressor/biotin-[acetyl-CoA-carboxylase] ligase
MSATQLEQALTMAGLTAPVHWQEVTGSTNEVAAALAADGAPEWTLVGSGHQTAGRGRRGRVWHDRPGGALMTSFVLRPRIAPESGGLLTLLAGAAWAEAATAVSGRTVRCKWPNDLLVDDEKVGGVLSESAIEDGAIRWVVVGSGINLVRPEGVDGAAGLGAGTDPVSLLGGFLARFAEGYRASPSELASVVGSRWSAVAATLGRRVAVVAVDGTRREGLATGVDEHGRLVLRTDDGVLSVASDEIEHLR